MPDPSTLILCSHGTRHPAGQRAVLRLAGAVAERFPHMAVRAAYVDVQEPRVRDVVTALNPAGPDELPEGGAVLVPALLSTGYHVKTDLVRAAATRPGIGLVAPLGPDPRLTDLLIKRLGEATGVEQSTAGDVVILAGAGSSDPDAGMALTTAAADLAARLGHPVAAGNAAGGRPRADLVGRARARRVRRVVVVSYLLAPGFFADKLAGSGADVVTAPLLGPDQTPEELVDLVADRAGLSRSSSPAVDDGRSPWREVGEGIPVRANPGTMPALH